MNSRLSFMGANFVARQAEWGLTDGWGEGVSTTEDWFRPADTFADRFDDLIADVASIGFADYDLWCAQLQPEWASREHVEAAKAVIRRHGMRIPSYAGGPFGATVETFEPLCAMLAELGIPAIGGYCRIAETDPHGMVRLLEQYDLRYFRENHAERSAAELAEWADSIGSDRVGVAVDTGWFAYHGTDPAAAITELGERVGYVHLKDIRAVGEHDTCALGEGIVDIRSCLDAVERIGYSGPLAIEHEPETFDPTDDIVRSAQAVERMLSVPAEGGRR